MEEIQQSLGKNVIQRLLKLIKFRNEYDAFNGEFIVRDSKSDEIHLFWKKDDKQCALFIDLKTNKSIISYLNENGKGIQYLV
jgi:sucrose 6(F)-phosphate phosphorylase